jgi:hypothetical protein
MNTSDVIRAIRNSPTPQAAAAAIIELSYDATPEDLLRVLGLTISLGAVTPAQLDAIVEHLGTPCPVATDPDVTEAAAAVRNLEEELLRVQSGTSSDALGQVAVLRRAIERMEGSLSANAAELARLVSTQTAAEALLKELE